MKERVFLPCPFYSFLLSISLSFTFLSVFLFFPLFFSFPFSVSLSNFLSFSVKFPFPAYSPSWISLLRSDGLSSTPTWTLSTLYCTSLYLQYVRYRCCRLWWVRRKPVAQAEFTSSLIWWIPGLKTINRCFDSLRLNTTLTLLYTAEEDTIWPQAHRPMPVSLCVLCV